MFFWAIIFGPYEVATHFVWTSLKTQPTYRVISLHYGTNSDLNVTLQNGERLVPGVGEPEWSELVSCIHSTNLKRPRSYGLCGQVNFNQLQKKLPKTFE